MDTNCRKLYVGIDVHRQEHKAAILTLTQLESPGGAWRNTKTLGFKNNSHDFEYLDAQIRSHVLSPDEVAIAVDHTGGHYSEPLVFFLQRKGYSVYYLASGASQGAQEAKRA